MRVLGIDPGTATTGFGVVDVLGATDRNRVTVVEYGVVRTSAKTPMAERLKEIHDALRGLMEELRPTVCVVEELFFSANVSTAITVGQARGVALLAAAESGLPVYEYPPNQVKQAVTGDGGADKRQMQDMLRMVLGLEEIPQPDDAADAVAAALCHVHMGRFTDL